MAANHEIPSSARAREYHSPARGLVRAHQAPEQDRLLRVRPWRARNDGAGSAAAPRYHVQSRRPCQLVPSACRPGGTCDIGPYPGGGSEHARLGEAHGSGAERIHGLAWLRKRGIQDPPQLERKRPCLIVIALWEDRLGSLNPMVAFSNKAWSATLPRSTYAAPTSTAVLMRRTISSAGRASCNRSRVSARLSPGLRIRTIHARQSPMRAAVTASPPDCSRRITARRSQ